jgi:hypothetical protein
LKFIVILLTNLSLILPSSFFPTGFFLEHPVSLYYSVLASSLVLMIYPHYQLISDAFKVIQEFFVVQSELNEASHKQRDDTVESLPHSRRMKVTETGGKHPPRQFFWAQGAMK